MRVRWMTIAAVMVIAGCSTQPSASDQPVEVDLAPSQTTGSTVPPPTVPPECDPALLEWSWTGEAIGVVNTGASRCEVYVFDTPIADPLMEPDVWLDAGARGELLIESVGECDSPTDVTEVELVVNGADIVVPVEVDQVCDLMLIAIYAVDAAG